MNKLLSWFCKICIKPIVDFSLIKEVKGQNNIPKRNFILVSNHQSHLDWIASAYPCVPRRFTYIGQVDRYTGLVGFGRNILYLIAGVIPINRKDNLSKKIALEKAVSVLKNGDVVIIYPEGTRSRTGEIQKGKTGAAKIHLKSGAPILPIAIKGTFELLPPGGKLKVKRSVKINIGQPLYFERERKISENLDCNSEEYRSLLQEITDKVMEEISHLYKEL